VAALRDRPPGRGVDLGSGGGVPGLVAASALPAWAWDLVEAGTRRAAFLRTALTRLDLTARARVLPVRAEDLGRDVGHRGRADAVTARSFGPPAVTAECAAPLLRRGGVLLVSDPPGGGPPGRWEPAGLAALGLAVVARAAGPPALVTLAQERPCPARYPRRPGIPAKRPLW
jgi:16S rRNA (guanine527-N7)-methyltransferase